MAPDLPSLDSQLLDRGLPELWEETGLQLRQGQFSWVPLGLWEMIQGPGKGPSLFNRDLKDPQVHRIASTCLGHWGTGGGVWVD